MAKATPRYQQLADFIARLVTAGTLSAGERAPSLRQISRDRGVSLATALQAYRLLEDRGVLEARPQSGYFVTGQRLLPAPSRTRPPRKALAVSISGVVLQLLERAADPRLAPLGCAIPSPQLLCASPLDRLLARIARTRGIALNTYTAPGGDLRLRRELARRAARWGQALTAQDVLLTCGCTEALALALQAVTRPGDTVAVESPTYFGLLHTIEMLGLRALELPTDPQSGVDVGALDATLRQRSVSACLFSSSFNNPLGCTAPEESKRALLRILSHRGVPLVEDDIYGDIHCGERRPRPYSALEPEADVIYCSSFSKTLAPGYRVGWIAPGRHMPRVLERKLASTLSGCALAQASIGEFLASGAYESHLRRIRRVFRENLERMNHAIHRTFPEGTRVTRPNGGFVLWLELPGAIDTRALFEQAVDSGVCFAPGDAFSASRRYGHCMRLSAGYPWSERIEGAVAEIGALACAAAGRRPQQGDLTD